MLENANAIIAALLRPLRRKIEKLAEPLIVEKVTLQELRRMGVKSPAFSPLPNAVLHRMKE